MENDGALPIRTVGDRIDEIFEAYYLNGYIVTDIHIERGDGDWDGWRSMLGNEDSTTSEIKQKLLSSTHKVEFKAIFVGRGNVDAVRHMFGPENLTIEGGSDEENGGNE